MVLAEATKPTEAQLANLDEQWPLVSIAVVTYNQREFLDECLRAILAQDYSRLEIVVADDGSTDGTKELIESYQHTHPSLFVVRRSDENRGVTANQQAALSACTGKYIAWMAGDDLMLPGKIRAQVAHMEANPQCSICYHDVELFDSDTDHRICLNSELDVQRRGTMKTLVRHGHFNAATSSMVRRSASPTQFHPAIPVASDWLYYVECLAGGGTIEPIPGLLGRQRRHSGNITASADRSQPVHLLVEHLQSCALIIGRWPQLSGHVRYRMARLLFMQRWQDGGAHYLGYIRASLRLKKTLRAMIAFAAALFGIRR